MMKCGVGVEVGDYNETHHILYKVEITLLHLIQNESLHKTWYKLQNTDLMMLFTFYFYISSHITYIIK